MTISLDSATAANVNRFLNETQLSEPSPAQGSLERQSASNNGISQHRFGSTPHINVEVQENGASSSEEEDANNNRYKKMLRYVPNQGFKGADESTTNGISVPNTFKHKSHPNARTKQQIGLSSVDEVSDSIGSARDEIRGDLHDLKTSTINRKNGDEMLQKFDNMHISASNTPSWMPAGLEDRWEEGAPKTSENEVHHAPSLDFLGSSSNTFVHNPQTGARDTPMWKRMAKQYQPLNSENSPLKHMFSSIDTSHETQPVGKQAPKAAHSGYASMSTFSTPVATRDSEMHLTQHQIHQLEDMLEKAKNEPDDFQIKGSPLKLFGNEYDTFTKAILSKFVDKVRSNANSVQRNMQPPVPAKLAAPKLKIKNFTKSGDYTDRDFMQNANNIFAHLQKKGFPAEPGPEAPEPSFHQRSQFLSRSQNTATSTPKAQKIKDDTRRESSDLYSYSTGTDSFGQPYPNTTEAINEYTEIEKTHLARSDHASTVSENDDHASYTFDELSDFESRSIEQTSSIKLPKKNGRSRSDSPSPRMDTCERNGSLPLFESSMSSVKQFMQENPETRASKKPEKGPILAKKESESVIKWKRPSQLRLLSDSSQKANLPGDPRVKGTVKPGKFPGQYGDMLFDNKKNKWVSKDKENDAGGSLDSIEDLVSDSSNASRSFTKSKGAFFSPEKNKGRNKLEVSFQVPEDDDSRTFEQPHDVTSVSEFGNATFSQSNKELVSLITGSTDEVLWESITAIDLSNKNIDRVENLEQYLPAVKSIDLSKNRLRFVEGLPSALYELDVTKNNLSDMTSFDKFHDLQVVNASFNAFQTFACLDKNVNLSKVNLTGNQIESLDGFPALHALTSINLSRNNISGKVHLANLELPNLKELNLSENFISSLDGIESLKNLRILNVNENRIVQLNCDGVHHRLKKLLCKFNDMKELHLENFPYLRILRLDGNSLVSITGLKKLDYLQELSAKSQSSAGIVETLTSAAVNIRSVDFSGNTSLSHMLPNLSVDAFYNVNQLNLSAVGLSSLPADFGEQFFNVRELNLSFNKLVDLKGLENMKQLKKLQVLSNNITRMEDILTGLQKSRKTLRVLDLRLNIINFEFYPYVFSPEELELAKENKENMAESPIPVQAPEDIESFTVHYNALSRSRGEWSARDNEFFTQMRKDGKDRKLKERLDYETILGGFFLNLKELDGGIVPHERRAAYGKSQM
ncbi:hypothetical protein OXX69_006800 [Metschnikowia pulcherrima]